MFVNLNKMLSENVTLTFYGPLYIQIVIIYEVKEDAPNLFYKNNYYHVRGTYSLYVSGE